MYKSNVPDCPGVVGLVHQLFSVWGGLRGTVSKEPRKSCLV